MSIKSLRFGPLALDLEVRGDGTLLAVHLPSQPPRGIDSRYYADALLELGTVPLPAPESPQQAAFWRELSAIALGSTCAYGVLAKVLKTAPRGVASRCASNRLLLRLPCHRVTGQQGLGGFRAGLEWKRQLLDWERRLAGETAAHFGCFTPQNTAMIGTCPEFVY